MWNRVSLVYLLIAALVFSLLSIHPSGQEMRGQLLFLAVSLTYPSFLAWRRPKTGFWKGALQLLIILSVTLICGFVSYLLFYAYFHYKRLGSGFHLLEVLGWTLGESLAFYLYLDAMPAAIIAIICYPIGFMASSQLFRLAPSVR